MKFTQIARRAELLVGNGVHDSNWLVQTQMLMSPLQFSSLTSNVVLLRLAIRNDPSTIRFW